MIDITLLREKPETILNNLHARNRKDLAASVARIQELDAKSRAIEDQVSALRAQRNAQSKTKPTPEQIKELQQVRERIQGMEQELETLMGERNALLLAIPNILHTSVPLGNTEEDNVELERVGEPTVFSFEPKPYFDIPSVAPHIDIERGAKVAGTRFYYLRGPVAQLERALMQYALDFVSKKGFTFVLPPLLVKEQALYGTGYFPNGRNEVYAVNPGEDDLYLIGTSEQPIMAMHGDEILDEAQLPLQYLGFSPCFRREAGTYGKDTQGILRVHQFNKVEMVQLCDPETSWQMHEKLISIAHAFYVTLELPFRTLQLCSADTGVQSAKTIDFEGWFPTQDKYRELGSASNTTDYQTRRLAIRMKRDGKTVPLHALNSTVVTDRALLAILENNQQEDGSVIVPNVLRPYCGFDRIYV